MESREVEAFGLSLVFGFASGLDWETGEEMAGDAGAVSSNANGLYSDTGTEETPSYTLECEYDDESST